MQYATCGKCRHLMTNHIEKKEEGIVVEIGRCREKMCYCDGYGRVPHAKIGIEGLKEIYKTGESISFSIHVRGFGSTSGLPDIVIKQIDITAREEAKKSAPKHDLPYLVMPVAQVIRIAWEKSMAPAATNNVLDFERIISIPQDGEPIISLDEPGHYEVNVTVSPNFIKQEFEIK